MFTGCISLHFHANTNLRFITRKLDTIVATAFYNTTRGTTIDMDAGFAFLWLDEGSANPVVVLTVSLTAFDFTISYASSLCGRASLRLCLANCFSRANNFETK